MGRYLKKRWRKLLAGFFACLMVFQAMGGMMDVAAYELGKVHLADTRGEYDNKDIHLNDTTLNKDTGKQKTSVLEKDPVIIAQEETYDENLEQKEKRTPNSKTYKLLDGTYVQETYFEPVHKKEDGQFVDIDNTLESTGKTRSNPIYENKDGLYSFKVQDQLMSITNESKQTFSIENISANLDTYTVKENVILYSEAYDNIDMEYRLYGNSVSASFYVNGTTNVKEIAFDIHKGDLKIREEVNALLLLGADGKVIYSLTKPLMYDADENIRATEFTYKEDNDTVHISLTLDTDWVNSTDRVYPIMMQSRASDETQDINVETSYNRSAEPDTTSQYYDLFVGYEDGTLTGGIFLGVARTYVHVSDLGLGADKEIIDAKLKLNKTNWVKEQWPEIAIGKTDSYVNPAKITWNNKPKTTQISLTDVRKSTGWQEFDIKSYIEDIYRGKNNTIEMKATNENASTVAHVFSSESSTGLPRVTIFYRDAFDVNPSLPINTFDTEMRIFSILNKGFEAFSFDGIAKPDAQMIFELVERGRDEVIQTETSKGKVSRYFVDPIYILNHIANTQEYKKDEINYTTDYIYRDRIPKFDTPYEYKVKAKSADAISTKELRTDSFIKYKVKTGDNLKNLAAYYGITIEQIKEDNNLKTNIIREDDVLLLRFMKDNDKVSKDVYTPPIRTVEYKAKYVNRGPRCYGGLCPIIDPVNATTGNYYNQTKDFTIRDADDFDFMRYYNSTGPQLSNMFGNGFTSPIESYVSYDKDGNILYFTGDGRIYEFRKDGNSYQSRTQDKLNIRAEGEIITIEDLRTDTIFTFDAYGYLDTIMTAEGTVTKIDYDAYGLITSIHVGDKKLDLSYNASKLVKSITLPSGKQVTYKYDDKRNLTGFTDASGHTKKYAYDGNSYLVTVTDQNGNTATHNEYDQEGRVLKQIDGNGNVSTISYGDHQTVIKKGNGSEEVYAFNEDYDILSITQDGKVTSKNTYDEYRNITSKTDADGKVTKYTYDKEDLLKAEYPDGTYEECRYDASGNITYQRERDGRETKNTYQGHDLISTSDNQNMSTVYVYDDKRRVLKETDQYGAVKSYTYDGNMIASITYSNGLVESFKYDANGNTIKESDNQGKTITYIYDAGNQMIQKNYYDGSSEQWTYDGNGNIASYKDRIGGITKNTYDNNNNLLTSVKGNLKTSKTYDAVNQLLTETDEKGLIKSYTYDINGNKASETDAYGHTIHYTYDADGNILETTDVYGSKETNEYQNGDLIKTTSNDGLITTYEYDSLHREIKKENPNGTVETKVYDGQLLKSETDEKGTFTEHFYDTYGREIKTTITYADGKITTTENSYDIFGNIIETNIDGAITKNTYDFYQQVTATTDPLGNTIKKEYDLDGNVIKEIDALGNTIKTVYDGNKNVLSVTDKNGNTETKKYNAEGQLIAETDALGFIKTYAYDAHGLLTAVTDPYKRTIAYAYDEFGNLLETKLEDRIIEKKEYDDYGREIYTRDQESVTTTEYDDLDRKAKTTNELTGLTVSYTYDKYGNVIQEKDSEGLATSYEYDTYQRKIRTTDPYKRVEQVSYDIRDHVTQTKNFDGTKTFSRYDAKGNLIQSVDALGKITKKEYNILNQLVHEESGGKKTEYVYDANGQQIKVKNLDNKTSTKTAYDANGNITAATDALGNITKTEYDAKNQVTVQIDANSNETKSEYDAYGNLIKTTDALGHSKQIKYNRYGLKEMEVDERGFATKYEYNDDLLPIKVTDAKDHVSTAEYNNQRQLIKDTNANGGVTSYEYDAYGRKAKITEPNGRVTAYEYDELGNVTKEKIGKKITINAYDKLGRLTKTSINDVIQTKNIYNDTNQIIKSYDANGNLSTYQYDDNGQIIYADEKGFLSQKEYDAEGNIIKQTDNKTLIMVNAYDANNRLIKTAVNDKVTVSKKYDANGNEIVSVEDGIEYRKSYDALNRIRKLEVPSAADSKKFTAVQDINYDESGNVVKVTYASGASEIRKYDASNNVIESIDRNGTRSLYEYDGLNNVIKVQNHEDRYVTYLYDEANHLTDKMINDKSAEYTYDEDGNLLKEKDEYGYVHTYHYDAFDRQIEQIKPDGTKITNTYDDLGNKLTENRNTYTYDSRNNVLTSTNKEGTVKNHYDAFNNKISVTDTNGKTVSYIYNTDNKVSEKAYGDIKVSYSYNDHGLLETVKKDGRILATYEYNDRNENIRLTQGDTVTLKTYDDLGRLLTQKSEKGKKSVFDASYTYDGNDNVIKEIIDSKENTYQYDAYDELTESHKYIDGKKIDTTYQHDIYGNQVVTSSSEGTKTYSYNDKNQVEKIRTDKGTIRYSYDDNGNVSKKINDDGRIDLYTYDDLGQLTKLEQGQYVYDYSYDAEKERISLKATDIKDYHYDIWYDYNVSLDVVSDRELDDTFRNLKEQVRKKEKNGNLCSSTLSDSYDATYYKEPEETDYLLDRSIENSIILKANDDISIYGDTLLQTGEETIVTGWNDSVVAKVEDSAIRKMSYTDYGSTKDSKSGFGYNEEMLDNSGLIYLRARYYDPETSRFVQIDTNYDGEKDSIASQNKYAYTLNNPYKYVDRDGNRAGVAGGIGGISGVIIDVQPIGKNKIKPKKDAWQPTKGVAGGAAIGIAGIDWNKVTGSKGKNSTSGAGVGAVAGGIASGIGFAKANGKGGGSHVIQPPTKYLIIEAKCPEKEKTWYEKAWDSVAGFGNDVWNGITDFGSAVWKGICDAGSFVVKKGKEFLSWVDSILDTAARIGAIIVCVVGAVAIAATMIEAISALAGFTLLGAAIGAFGTIGYSAGTFALYTGVVVMSASGVQMISGYSGYRLDGSKLSKSQAQARIVNGQTNLALSYMGSIAGGSSMNANSGYAEGASGAGTSYDSFNAFKKANPVQTKGNQWHHIVEQSQQGKSGFSVQQINNTNNLIELTPSQHSQISGYYSSKPSFTNGLTVRDWLADQSFETQYQFGVDFLKQLGIK